MSPNCHFIKLSEINQFAVFATTLLGFARVEKAKTVFFVVFATKKIGCEHHVFRCEHHVFGCEHHVLVANTISGVRNSLFLLK